MLWRQADAVLGMIVVLLAMAACDDRDVPYVGRGVSAAAADTAALKPALAAVNQVVRDAGDCDAARAGREEALRQLDEAAGRVQTATARATLQTLRKQLDRVAQLCP